MERFISLIPTDISSVQQEFMERELCHIGQDRLDEMIEDVVYARENAYAPYSEFKVGAVLLCKSGEIYAAPNNEFVTYSETGHAEGNAIAKAISEGEFRRNGREFLQSMIICASGETGPCGRCRQCIAEHAVNSNALILSVNEKGNPTLTNSLRVLLPSAFTPAELGIK